MGVWAVLVVFAVLLFRSVSRSSDIGAAQPGPVPEQLLAERFARGEIDENEYRRRLAVLRHGPVRPPSGEDAGEK
ncbi:SHOCT domain-containing protein [Streptomyces sp. ME18-1-4]|uniref:SHOCT domain-containing protein n=1 Tax=Streptomyces sp. ME18-1-4 TaxID=3028685 RepID=UPI0029A40CA8|nr:SHOCT domain-containing protein [Streptomyces sp. ME18-1-4]MDX3241376.1 SHOCT domain-containing protein [Streptomyces sp. ME18-1-4]